MAIYAVVGQHNWREMRHDGHGGTYTVISYREPKTLHAAENWPATRIIEADEPPIEWGCGTYVANDDGTLTFVGANWDSSG